MSVKLYLVLTLFPGNFVDTDSEGPVQPCPPSRSVNDLRGSVAWTGGAVEGLRGLGPRYPSTRGGRQGVCHFLLVGHSGWCVSRYVGLLEVVGLPWGGLQRGPLCPRSEAGGVSGSSRLSLVGGRLRCVVPTPIWASSAIPPSPAHSGTASLCRLRSKDQGEDEGPSRPSSPLGV